MYKLHTSFFVKVYSRLREVAMATCRSDAIPLLMLRMSVGCPGLVNTLPIRLSGRRSNMIGSSHLDTSLPIKLFPRRSWNLGDLS